MPLVATSGRDGAVRVLEWWGRLGWVRDGLRTKMWPIPTVGIMLGLAMGIGLPRLEGRTDDDRSTAAAAWLFGGGPSAARTLLGAIAGSLITVTALTFSLTVVTLQLASSQFSPRLLRTFARDRFVHVTLAVVLGTFTYALAVLRTVRDASDQHAFFVPRLSVALAFVLGVLSVLGLVLFLAHLAEEIRVETMLRNVHRDATETVRRVLSRRRPEVEAAEAVPVTPDEATVLLARSSGFVVQIDESALLAAAVEADAVLILDCSAGSSLVAATPIGFAWRRLGPIDSRSIDELGRVTADALTTGFERTAANDPQYGLQQLADVAIKALSPGINDPTTAVHALGHCSALLCELACHDLGPRVLHDADGHVRIVLRRPGFADMLEFAIGQPRRYGAGDPQVLSRLFSLLAELAWVARDRGQQTAIASQLERLRATVARQDFDPFEQALLDGLAVRVEAALEGRWCVAPRAT